MAEMVRDGKYKGSFEQTGQLTSTNLLEGLARI